MHLANLLHDYRSRSRKERHNSCGIVRGINRYFSRKVYTKNLTVLRHYQALPCADGRLAICFGSRHLISSAVPERYLVTREYTSHTVHVIKNIAIRERDASVRKSVEHLASRYCEFLTR